MKRSMISIAWGATAILMMAAGSGCGDGGAVDAGSGNRKQAAERLGIGLRTLYDKLERYELS